MRPTARNSCWWAFAPARATAWLSACRRLHRRYERKVERFLAFAGIAAALIRYRRLVDRSR
jgi:transposase